MHLTSKSVAPEANEIGLNRLRKICEYAQSIGVRVAFENTKIKGYQEYVLKHLNLENVGICLDSGHLHAHFHDELDFSLFDHKIFCVHLHDNFGVEDEHLIPFDGNLDWHWLMNQLKDCHYDGVLSMELVYRNEYLKMDPVEFYKKGFDVGNKLEELLNGNHL
jgi:sugar phosphate isomerase/epimerase